MKYEIILAPEAIQDLKLLDAYQRAKIKDLIEVHLRHEPTKISKSRIKRLKGLRHPQYRLKIDDFRIFYDIKEDNVEILTIILKSKAAEWLKKAGEGI
ncbi:MAG: type II toxin-antitoxin system RelE/ParE family toxin [Thermodesulfovibrionales bacterium]|nr:type II toxin-antitoxin system RelE/ParE family toxin [Thermodesulfovibrionales bacterium]